MGIQQKQVELNNYIETFDNTKLDNKVKHYITNYICNFSLKISYIIDFKITYTIKYEKELDDFLNNLALIKNKIHDTDFNNTLIGLYKEKKYFVDDMLELIKMERIYFKIEIVAEEIISIAKNKSIFIHYINNYISPINSIIIHNILAKSFGKEVEYTDDNYKSADEILHNLLQIKEIIDKSDCDCEKIFEQNYKNGIFCVGTTLNDVFAICNK